MTQMTPRDLNDQNDPYDCMKGKTYPIRNSENLLTDKHKKSSKPAENLDSYFAL